MKYAGTLVLLSLFACSSANEPHFSSATLLVENTTCNSTRAPIQILGFPTNQPNTPGGMWSIEIGVLTTRSGCFTIPASSTFRIISNGVTENTFTWTLLNPLALGTPVPPATALQAGPNTATFVPATAAGWKVSLPGGVGLSATEGCTP
jgi:hypothetical protein